jgi:hypothetical protein
MHAIEFEAIADQHLLRLPAQVPDGAKLRVILLMDEAPLSMDRPRRKPSPKLAGSVVMHDDLLEPAVPERDWDVLHDRA